MTEEQWKAFREWMDRMEKMKKKEVEDEMRILDDISKMIYDMWMVVR